jgi:16S rRNA (guanine966-N2)-methyltransferase
MRVIGGVAKGRRLQAPPGTLTRPTSDRVREAIFNALWSRSAIDGATVVDLFAGSGAMGIEALSRGAARAVFVEANPDTRRTIAANLAACGLQDRAEVVADTADRYLDRAIADGTRFDVAFCDPPYAFEEWEHLLARLPARLVVIESGAPVTPPDGWVLSRTATYGSTWVGFAEADV